jgi:hypothetical protein
MMTPVCQFCDDTGIEPCGNCDERDCGLDPNGRRACFIDGEEYGAGPCRKGCANPNPQTITFTITQAQATDISEIAADVENDPIENRNRIHAILKDLN